MDKKTIHFINQDSVELLSREVLPVNFKSHQIHQ